MRPAAMLRYALPAAALLLLSACDHKELCFNHPEHVARYATDVHINYELIWEQPYEGRTHWQADWPSTGFGFSYDALRPHVPEGVRMFAYAADGMRTENNLLPQGEEIFLPPGDNSILFYNNDTEAIVFNDMWSYEDATATTRGRSRASYTGNPHYAPSRADKRAEVTVDAPDVLFGHYSDRYTQTIVTTPPRLDITMRPLVFTYVVRYSFTHGYNYVALARGALSGMAGSVFLHNGHTSTDAVTVLYDCELKADCVEALVNSFGIPDFPNPNYSRQDGTFALNLEVRLHNGKILNFYFDVTDQVADQPYGGVIRVGGIEITDKQGEGGGSGGFDVDVDGWGEFTDVPVEF